MKKKFNDERITGQLQNYGHQAFGILTTLLLISTFVKLFVMNLEMKYWVDTFLILLVACAYFTVRCIMSGLFIAPSKSEDRKQLSRLNIISCAGSAIMWGVLMFLFDVWYGEEPFNLMRSIIGTAIASIFFFFGLLGLSALMAKLSNKRANKDIE